MRAVWVVGLVLAIPLASCTNDDWDPLKEELAALERRARAYLRFLKKESRRKENNMVASYLNFDIMEYFDRAVYEVSAFETEQELTAYFSRVMDVFYADKKCREYLNFRCFAEATKEHIIQLSMNLRRRSLDETYR